MEEREITDIPCPPITRRQVRKWLQFIKLIRDTAEEAGKLEEWEDYWLYDEDWVKVWKEVKEEIGMIDQILPF
jgi:hypothetical protein